MPRVISPCEVLYNGVSQQNPSARLSNQGEIQVNAEASIEKGLSRRRPLKFKHRMLQDVGDVQESKVHFMRRSAGVIDTLLIRPGGEVDIFNNDGTQQLLWKQRRWRVKYDRGFFMEQLDDHFAAVDYTKDVDDMTAIGTSVAGLFNTVTDSSATNRNAYDFVSDAGVPETWEDGDTLSLQTAAGVEVVSGTYSAEPQMDAESELVWFSIAQSWGSYPSTLTAGELSSIAKAVNTTDSNSEAVVDYASFKWYGDFAHNGSLPCKHVSKPTGEWGEQTGELEISDTYWNQDDDGPSSWEAGQVVTSTTVAIPEIGLAMANIQFRITEITEAFVGPVADASSPRQLKALTLNDYTFLLDPEQVVTKSGVTEEARPYEALAWVKQGGSLLNFGLTVETDAYRATIEVKTRPSTSTAEDAIDSWNTDGIAEICYWAMQGKISGAPGYANGVDGASPRKINLTYYNKTTGEEATATYNSLGDTGVYAEWTAFFGESGPCPSGSLVDETFELELSGSVIYLKNTSNDFTISSFDSIGDTAIKLAKTEVDQITDLPMVSKPGFRCKILGASENSNDDYYVEFRRNKNNTETEMGKGLWYETAGFELDNEIDALTMPWALIKCGDEDSGYCYTPLDWDVRDAGDEDSAPDPSFVDEKLTGIYFWKNRLGFVTSAGTTVMSEVGEFFNFWPKTVLTLLDSDVIDTQVGLLSADEFSGTATLAENLVFFSPFRQYALSGGDILTPATVAVVPTTVCNVATSVEPVSVANTVYFAVPRGGNTAAYQYYIGNDAGTHAADEVTQHVPQYLPADIVEMTASSSDAALVCHAGGDACWLYRWRFRGNQELVQAAWYKYDYSSIGDSVNILGCQFINDELHFVILKDGDVLHCTQAIRDLGHKIAPTLPCDIHYDLVVSGDELTCVYSPENDTTTITGLPFAVTDETQVLVMMAGGSALTTAIILSRTASQLVIEGDYSSSNACWVGQPYTTRYRFSQVYARDNNQFAQAYGVTKVLTMVLYYSDCGHLTATVTHIKRANYSYSRSITSSACDATGTLQLPIRGANDSVYVELTSNSYLPFNAVRADWELVYERYGA